MTFFWKKEDPREVLIGELKSKIVELEEKNVRLEEKNVRLKENIAIYEEEHRREFSPRTILGWIRAADVLNGGVLPKTLLVHPYFLNELRNLCDTRLDSKSGGEFLLGIRIKPSPILGWRFVK